MSKQEGQPKPLPDEFPHVEHFRSAGLTTWTHLSESGFIAGRSFTEIDGVGTSRAKDIARWMCETDKLKRFHVKPGEDRMSVHIKPKQSAAEAGEDQMPESPEQPKQQAEAQESEAQQQQHAPPEETDEPAQPDPQPEDDPAPQGKQDAPQGEPDVQQDDEPAQDPAPQPDRNDYTPEVPQNHVDSGTEVNMERLSEYFQPDEIEWRPTQVSPKKGYKKKNNSNFGKGRALALAYVTNRAIQNRLDKVVGPARWKNEFKPGPNGGVICGLSLYLKMPGGGYEWVTKWDGAENTNFEAVKGGLSDSMKRAGYQWGIGRYLYRLPTMWLDCKLKSKGNGNVGFKEWIEEPELPPNFLPKKGDSLQRDNPERRRAEKHFHAAGNGFYGKDWNEKREWVISTYAKKNGFHADSTHDLTTGQLDELAKRMKAAQQQQKKQRQQGQPQQQKPQQGQSQKQRQQGAPQGRQKGGGGSQGGSQSQGQSGGQGGTGGPQQGDFGAFDNPEEDLPTFGDSFDN